MANDRIFFYYDPQRQGYDTVLWKTVSGTPAVNGTNLRLNNASMIHYGDIFKGEMTINLTIPVGPTAGDNRKFGFNQLNSGSFAYFQIAGTAFTAEVADGQGNTDSIVLTWDTTWTATATEFKVVWLGIEAAFFVNGIRQALTRVVGVPKNPLSAFVANANADNMDIKYIEVKNVHNYI